MLTGTVLFSIKEDGEWDLQTRLGETSWPSLRVPPKDLWAWALMAFLGHLAQNPSWS